MKPSREVWASDLAARHLGGPKTDDLIAHTGPDTHCAFCGKPIRTGDLYEPATALGEYFSDTRDLADNTRMSCPACSAVRTKKAMFALQRALVTDYGIYSIAPAAARSWLFLTPPEPPFVAVLTTATLQHLIWRTPVTLSSDLIVIRHGARLHTIRPRLVAEARDVCLRLRDADPKIKNGPYVLLDRAEEAPTHGLLREQVWQTMSQEERAIFNRLTPGEVWALAHVISVSPSQPQPVTIKGVST